MALHDRPRFAYRCGCPNGVMRESIRWSTAFHEAGHAVAEWRRGLNVQSATIVAPGIFGTVEGSDPLHGIRLEWDGSARARRRAESAHRFCVNGRDNRVRFGRQEGEQVVCRFHLP